MSPCSLHEFILRNNTRFSWSLSKLEELYLDSNFLTGPIPRSFKGLVSLHRLELQGNNLTGEFPDLRTLKNLSFIDCSDNAITGEFPATLPASIIEVSMRNNSFRGALPRSLRELVFFVNNGCEQESAEWLTSINPLQPPISVATHTLPQQLDIFRKGYIHEHGLPKRANSFGSEQQPTSRLLPSFMAMMPKLSALSVENNKFTGMIPTQQALKAVGRTFKFARLLLGGNYLFGTIPMPFLGLKPGSSVVSLVDTCMYRCPTSFFFCQGRGQKSVSACKSFGPLIP